MDAQPVRSRSTRPTWKMSPEELARVVGEHRGWTIRGNAIRTEHGRLIGNGWTDVAALLTRRGWITRNAVNWRRIDADPKPLPRFTRGA